LDYGINVRLVAAAVATAEVQLMLQLDGMDEKGG